MSVYAAELHADTLAAFDRYVRATESRMDGSFTGRCCRGSTAPRQRMEAWRRNSDTRRSSCDARRRTRNRLSARFDSSLIGTTFAPGNGRSRHLVDAKLRPVSEDYSPNAVAHDHRQGDTFKIYLQLFMKKYRRRANSEYDVHYTRVSAYASARPQLQHADCRSADPHTDEKEAPIGQTTDSSGASTNTVFGRASRGDHIQCVGFAGRRYRPVSAGSYRS
jgi:hypothetical protein